MSRRRPHLRRSTALIALTILATPFVAWADADEASLHVQALGGVARTAEHGRTATAPLAGVAARATYARSDLYAWELLVAGSATNATYDQVETDVAGSPQMGTLDRATYAMRTELGAHLRFGVRFIPTLHAGLGAQVRRLGAASLVQDGRLLGTLDATTHVDLTASVGLGVDVRLGRHLVVGATIGGLHALPVDGGDAFDAMEAGIHVATYWYPGWFPLAGWRDP